MSRAEQRLEYMRIREEVGELRQEILMIDQRLMRLIEKIRRDLCNVGLELTQDPMARLKKWHDSGIVEAGELVRRSQEIQPVLAQKEQALKSYDSA
jgi:hypothetical protein